MTVVRSAYPRQLNDLYETPAWVTRALLAHYPMGGLRVWEPAAGNHAIADVLRGDGANVTTSDVETYDRPHDAVFDFIGPTMLDALARPFDAVVTNPPYGPGNRIAAEFARTALMRCQGWVALLLTAKFDFGKTRQDLFGNDRFVSKIALLDRPAWFGEGGGTEDYAWYVWGGFGYRAGRPSIIYAGNPAKGKGND